MPNHGLRLRRLTPLVKADHVRQEKEDLMRGYNERLHWCIFNVMVRIFGMMAMLFAAVSISWGIFYYTHPHEAKNAEAERWAEYRGAKQTFSHKTLEPDILGGVVTGDIGLGVFVAVIGIAILSVRPYRPDLGDTASSYSVGTRSWWTGEPKNVSTNPMPNKEDAPDQKAVR